MLFLFQEVKSEKLIVKNEKCTKTIAKIEKVL